MVGNKKITYPDLLLVENDRACATIVVAQKPNKKTNVAALDLQNIIKQMTGVTLPIKHDNETVEGTLILVGPSRLTTEMGICQPCGYPDNERVIVRRTGNRLVLLGNDDGLFTGTQFAVTMLLERLGCGWFGIEDLWHVIPRKDRISVGYINIDVTPRFESRQTWVYHKNRELALRWYQGGSNKDIEHAYSILFPREKYFDKHPEWYCMIDGQRDPYKEWWQMCYSNKEVLLNTIKKVGEFFDNNPTYTQATLAANDGFFDSFCQCEECKKMGTPSETMVAFANKVAQGLESKYPDKQLMIFAYFPTYDPPRKVMPLHKNIVLMFCKESCMFHSVDTGPDCGYHIRYQYDFGHEHYELPWMENAKKWIEMTSCKNVAVWEWYCPAAASSVWKDLPWVQGDVAFRNQLCFERLGARYVYYDQGPVDGYNDTEKSYPLRWPLWYVAAKGMWDGRQTASQILMDACKKLYEEAADIMFSYYMSLADINEQCHAKAIAWHMPEPYEFYTPQAIARVDRIVKSGNEIIDKVSEAVALRMKNQFDLWQKAKQVIKNTENNG